MLSDITSDQQDYPRCGHCGVPLSGRFTRCPSCHAHPVDTLDAHPAPPPLKIPLDPPPSTIDARLPARRIWRPSPRALANPYDVVEEPVVAAPPHQRLRQSLVMSGSVLVVASAVYLGFIHSNDSGVGPPIGVSGKVKTQDVVPPIAVVPHPAAPLPNRSTAVTAQRPAIVASQHSPAATGQRPVNETTQRPAIVTAQRAPAANTQRSTAANEQRPTIAATSHTPTTTTQRPTVIASQRAAAVRLPPLPPANPPLPAPRRVAAAAPETTRTAGNTSNSGGNAPDRSRPDDVSRHIKAARFDLQQNNLSATKARLAAAIAVQPGNRDALNMRSTLNTREQQRDALLSLARSCGTIARWTCVRHSAGSALQIDSSSKEAQRLVMLAARESEPAFTLPAPSVPDPVPDTPLDNHH